MSVVVLGRTGSTGAALLRNSCRGSELASQPDQQRLERERRRDLQLLGLPPGCAHELAGLLGSVHSLEGGVRSQLVEPIDVDSGRLGTGRNHYEVAVPGLELLEQRQQLLTLGTSLGAPDALLCLPPRELEGLDLQLGRLLGLRPSLGYPGEERLGAVGRLEGGVDVDRPRDLDERRTASCRRVTSSLR